MAKVIFKQGASINLPVLGTDSNTLYFANDLGCLYKSVGDGLPLQKFSDCIFVDVLPLVGVKDKVYIVKGAKNIQIHVWDEKWNTLVSGGQVVDDERIDILFGLVNRKDVLTYNENDEIIKVTTTGEVEETIDYEYDVDGNITKETINRQDKVVVNTFGYDENGSIIEINTIVQ